MYCPRRAQTLAVLIDIAPSAKRVFLVCVYRALGNILFESREKAYSLYKKKACYIQTFYGNLFLWYFAEQYTVVVETGELNVRSTSLLQAAIEV